jgi:hypothetical protein
MTKVKDLVSVTVDTALVLFPIDQERYELEVAISQKVRSIIFDGDPAPDVSLWAENVRVFIGYTDGSYHQCARDFARSVGTEVSYTRVTDPAADRARRLIASIPNAAPVRLSAQWDPDFHVRDLVAHLWMETFVRLALFSIRKPPLPRDYFFQVVEGMDAIDPTELDTGFVGWSS